MQSGPYGSRAPYWPGINLLKFKALNGQQTSARNGRDFYTEFRKIREREEEENKEEEEKEEVRRFLKLLR